MVEVLSKGSEIFLSSPKHANNQLLTHFHALWLISRNFSCPCAAFLDFASEKIGYAYLYYCMHPNFWYQNYLFILLCCGPGSGKIFPDLSKLNLMIKNLMVQIVLHYIHIFKEKHRKDLKSCAALLFVIFFSWSCYRVGSGMTLKLGSGSGRK